MCERCTRNWCRKSKVVLFSYHDGYIFLWGGALIRTIVLSLTSRLYNYIDGGSRIAGLSSTGGILMSSCTGIGFSFLLAHLTLISQANKTRESCSLFPTYRV